MKILMLETVYLVNDANEVADDIICPVNCGLCCAEWKGVKELKNIHRHGSCPYLRVSGCKLPRKRRPLHCNAFICQLGILAVTNQVSNAEISSTVQGRKQSKAFSFLGKKPKLAEIDLLAVKLTTAMRTVLDKM